MMKNTQYSQKILIFHGRRAPEEGFLVGYGALIEYYRLAIPIPDNLVLISEKNRKYTKPGWLVFGPRYRPAEELSAQLVFAIKYEGLNLLFFKKLFQKVSKEEIAEIIQSEYTGQYNRKIWFLYEWLMQELLPIPDLNIKNFVPLIDEELQYASQFSLNSSRHRIQNNLPGTVNFCPMINRTSKLESYIRADFSEKTKEVISGVHKDILLRTSAFLMLKDSKASFSIEGENPGQNRAVRWGRAIGQAGKRPLNKDELVRLQQIIIENSRFVKMGYRTEGGFVGEHDRTTGEPIPEHISARWDDLDTLMAGLLESSSLLEEWKFHPVLTAAMISFGFVFIHPFIDGNGRLHRYLIHHLLTRMNFAPQGIIFPVSAAILVRIDDYRKILETFSQPLLDFIEWRKTDDNNIEVLNETIDYYRYFDATRQTEFLFECVDFTILKIIPEEVSFLQKYDAMKTWLDDKFQMPDKTIALLIRLLEQNDSKLSKRARDKEFAALSDKEILEIETHYKLYFEK
jgi:Fic family protein